MAEVSKVAEFFIQVINQSEDDQITNLKLNKLLYYAQGVCLARTGKPLFFEKIEAWPLGPVVPSIYHRYKCCGKNSISMSEESVDRASFAEEELDVMLDVLREFGQYTGAKLVTLTHLPGTPWSEAQATGKTTLEPEVLRQFFLKNRVPTLQERITAPRVSALPADWYDPNEDGEWEAYQ